MSRNNPRLDGRVKKKHYDFLCKMERNSNLTLLYELGGKKVCVTQDERERESVCCFNCCHL